MIHNAYPSVPEDLIPFFGATMNLYDFKPELVLPKTKREGANQFNYNI